MTYGEISLIQGLITLAVALVPILLVVYLTKFHEEDKQERIEQTQVESMRIIKTHCPELWEDYQEMETRKELLERV